MTSLQDWLQAVGLGQYSETFSKNGIDFDVVAELNDTDLRELGLNLGDRKRFLSAVSSMNETRSPRAETSNSAPVDAERRQLTVLFCDMVGFTELASRLDPEVLQSIVATYEDTCASAITRYEGYVFQRLGDGIVAFFGYPLAHEGEAERAIRAGLDIVEALSELEVPEAGRLQVRIGVATGMVVVASAEKGAVGETMNLAARLQAVAPVDTVVVSERVRQLAGGSFDYEDLGEQTLKGITQSTHAYCIVRLSQVTSRFEAAHGERLTPLVGRDLELGLLMDRWARAQEGEGQVVLLCGEPGIGKSRILDALRERLEGEGVKSRRFQCSPYYVNSAFWPSISNFERALKYGREESPEAKLDKLESLIVGHYQRPLSDVRFIASMLSIPCDERYGEVSMTPQKFKDETLRALVDLTEATARMRPSVMFYEDAHWADPTSLEVLDLLIDRVREVPLLVVLTYRPEFQNRWAEQGHVSALNLSKLTRTQSRAMIAGVTSGKALPDGLLDQILSRTDGVPLFVEELTKSILESDQLKESEDCYEYVGNARGITIPSTLRDSLVARLDRYFPGKQIAQVGAAIGREFGYELVSAVANSPLSEIDEGLDQLTSAGLVFRRGASSKATYTFKHALVQDAAYQSLLISRRQDLHCKIAEAIEDQIPSVKDTEPEVLAHHLTNGERNDLAIPLWQRAGELALNRMALTEAIAHLERGLELVATLPNSSDRDARELALRVPLGRAWMALEGWGATNVWNSMHPALSMAKQLEDTGEMMRIVCGLQINVQTQGRVTEAFQWAQEILDIAKRSDDRNLLMAAYDRLCVTSFWTGRLIESLEHGKKALALLSEERKNARTVDILSDSQLSIGIFASQTFWMLGYPDRAAEESQKAVTRARRFGSPFDLGWALRMGSEVFIYRGECEEARRRAEECEQLGREHSLPLLVQLFAQSVLGLGSIRQHRFAEGIAQLEAVLAMWNASRLRHPYYKAVLGEGLSMLGQSDEALKLIDEAIEQVQRPDWGERIHYAEILRLKGQILARKGDLVDGERSFLASLDWAHEQQAKSWELRTSVSLARLWQSQDKHKEAHDLLAPVYDWFTEGFDTHDLKEAKALLEELEVTA